MTRSIVPFIDPRTNPTPPYRGTARRLAADTAELAGLLTACKGGRLYDAEAWIQSGRPLQLSPEAASRATRLPSPLTVAIQAGNVDLLRLLLCNGYRTELEPKPPLDLVLAERRWEMLELLLAWGADPRSVSPESVLDTYRSDLFERFLAAGVDLTAGGAMARALGRTTSNRPLYGFARAWHGRDPRIARALAVGLCLAVRAKNDKAVSLCLWAGADPRRRVVEPEGDPAEDGDGSTAFEEAIGADAPHYLKRLGFDSTRDSLDELWRHVHSLPALRALAAFAPPSDWQPIIARFVWSLDLEMRFGRSWISLAEVEEVLGLGGPLGVLDRHLKTTLRRLLLHLEESNAKRLFRLLADPAHLDRAAFIDLISQEKLAARYSTWSPHHGPDRKLMTELAQTRGVPAAIRRMAKERITRQPPLLTQTTLRDAEGEHSYSREELYELVWSEPMFTLSKRFGLSDNGLRKRCKAMQVPTPQKGHWQALKSGKRTRRTPLKPL